MTIVKKLIKYFFILVLAVMLFITVRSFYYMYNEAPEPVFKVYGDQSILNKMVINLEPSYWQEPYTFSKMQTLLYKGKLHVIKNEFVGYYKIYFSYGDQVGVLAFENLEGKFNSDLGRINYIYVSKKDNSIWVRYFSYKSLLGESEVRAKNHTLLLDDFFKEKQIPKDTQAAYKDKFYNFYDPVMQQYKREHLAQHNINSFKNRSLERKKEYGLTIEDLQKIDIDEKEREILIKYTKSLQQAQ